MSPTFHMYAVPVSRRFPVNLSLSADRGWHKGRYFKGKMHGWGVMRTGILFIMGKHERTNDRKRKPQWRSLASLHTCPFVVARQPLRVPSRVGACFCMRARARVKAEHVLVRWVCLCVRMAQRTDTNMRGVGKTTK